MARVEEVFVLARRLPTPPAGRLPAGYPGRIHFEDSSPIFLKAEEERQHPRPTPDQSGCATVVLGARLGT